jgi:hypothetical protein
MASKVQFTLSNHVTDLALHWASHEAFAHSADMSRP